MSLEQKNTAAVVINKDGSLGKFDEKDVLFAAAEKILGDSLESGSLEIAGEGLRRLKNLSYASAISLAKLLHGVNQNWMEFSVEDGDSFLGWAVRETGLDLQTVKRRVCEWEFLQGNYIPKDFRSKISDFNVRQLDKVYSVSVSAKENKGGGYLNFIEEDYDISDKQWLALSEACDEEMVGEIVREIKGKEKNSNNLALKIDENGDIWAYQKKHQHVLVGHLRVQEEDELVQKSIRRICENSGITEQNEY